ncbi:hypothetical protein ABTZ58_05160 [Streptomyces sp. NPDC094143]|uniref:hypothetical protein n=1 Tax=Streptomyces sp. NPDC094143 TaxID=3155310 RepID=UPI003316AB29
MADFHVNTTTAGDQFQPAVDALFGTQYLELWSDESDFVIKGQFLGTDGDKLGDEIAVSRQPAEGQGVRPLWPSVLSAGISGQFAVWLETPFNAPPPAPSVKLQRFAEGRMAGPQTLVTADADPRVRPSLTFMIDGGVLVTWASPRADQRIRARRYRPDGSPATPEFTVSTTEGFHEKPAATVLADGNVVVAWSTDPSSVGGGRLTLRFFDFEGNALTEEIRPNVGGFTGVNGLTLLDTQRFVVTHIERVPDSDLGQPQTTVAASVFEADGTELFDITAGSPVGFTRTSPAVSHLPGGRFLMTWIEQSADTFDTVPTVMAKVCSDSQGSLGDKVQVSTAAAGRRFHTCAATAFGDGPESALVTWADDSGLDGDPGLGVRARTYHVNGPGLLVDAS